jgi:two-component system OmpR family sensor kinase
MRLSLPDSLRWRLSLLVALIVLITGALAFAVVYLKTGAQLEHQADLDLRGDVTQLQDALRPDGTLPLQRAQASVSRYVGAQPYSATSTLLFVLIPGSAPISSQASVFSGRGARGGRTLAVRRLGYSTERLRGVGQLRVLERRLTIARRSAIVGVAEPLAIVARAQHGVAGAFVMAGGLSLVLALLAAYLVGSRVTAPLRRMASVAARVDAGDLEPRMSGDSRRGEEVRVLAEAFNHMLDRLADAFERQRAFLADASHELRTPLTVVRGQLELLASSDAPSPAEVHRVERVVQAEVVRMTRLVDDLMLLAAAGHTDFLRPEPIDLPAFTAELWDGLTLTTERRVELGPMPSGTLVADPDRLAQALRNLARNAIEHTRPDGGLVRLEGCALPGGQVRLTVLDDGPGIPEQDRERVFERLVRLEASRSREGGGAGLGLAIVRAIVEAHGGSVRAGAGPDGAGARIDIVLPRFTPGREPSLRERRRQGAERSARERRALGVG